MLAMLAPKEIHFFDALPRTAVDKISRPDLRSAIAAGAVARAANNGQ